jgi:hypothetical protein
MVERDDDDAFGHEREVDGDPVDSVGGDEATALTGRDVLSTQPYARALDQAEKLRGGDGDERIAGNFAADFTQNDALRRGFEARKNVFQKIGHGDYFEAARATAWVVS